MQLSGYVKVSDGPADYRKEMILEVIAWCRYEGTWIIEVRDIREDDTQEFDAVFLRPLTARDLVAISAPRHPLSTAIYPINPRTIKFGLSWNFFD